MIPRSLSPVGHPVSLSPRNAPAEYFLPGYHSVFLQSGTQALAFALLCLKQKYQGSEPEVIIPGYCCPDLVAAARYAGVKPVPVDIDQNDPSYQMTSLEQALGDRVIAVIAVNFLGIKERLGQIRTLIGDRPIAIIEDNAQWYPDEDETVDLAGDFVTFSFGRGKAVNLMGGGLVAIRDGLNVADIPLLSSGSGLEIYPKAMLLNWLTHPWAYYWIEHLPFLHLGQTVYHELESISSMPDAQRRLISANIDRARQRNRHRETALHQVLQSQNLLSDILRSKRHRRLLRYPCLLQDPAKRNQMLYELERRGLGASPMYDQAIVNIAGVADAGVHGNLPNAESFAKRFLTLPLHERVSSRDIDEIGQLSLTLK